MAELTSGLTSVVFSPYSKMFIGGLSWQTSPGETVILRYFGLFCPSLLWLTGECSPAAASAVNVRRAGGTVWDILSVCACTVLFLISVHLKSSIRPLCASRGIFERRKQACPVRFRCQMTRHVLLFFLSTDSLRDYFSKFGEIRECMVMRDPTTKRSR